VASKIKTLKEIVQKDPKNLPAWVELGNLYFDSDQPKEAIEAYSKYLTAKPDNPDVRTDMGIMYRRLGEFDRALKNFEKRPRSIPNILTVDITSASSSFTTSKMSKGPYRHGKII